MSVCWLLTTIILKDKSTIGKFVKKLFDAFQLISRNCGIDNSQGYECERYILNFELTYDVSVTTKKKQIRTVTAFVIERTISHFCHFRFCHRENGSTNESLKLKLHNFHVNLQLASWFLTSSKLNYSFCTYWIRCLCVCSSSEKSTRISNYSFAVYGEDAWRRSCFLTKHLTQMLQVPSSATSSHFVFIEKWFRIFYSIFH